MITLTQDYATNSLSLYVNGECKLTRDMPADMKNVATFGSANAQYNIGAPVDIFDQWSSDGKLDGRVDSLQIYGQRQDGDRDCRAVCSHPLCGSGSD